MTWDTGRKRAPAVLTALARGADPYEEGLAMTVAELVAKLRDYPPNMVVSVDGHEAGITDAITFHEVSAYVNVGGPSYYGEHEIVGGGMDWRAADADRLTTEFRLLLSRHSEVQ